MTMRWAASWHRKYLRYARTKHHRSLSCAMSFLFSLFFILFYFISLLSFLSLPHSLSLSLSSFQCVTNKWLNWRGTRLIIELEGRKQVSAGLRTRPTNFGRCWTSVITGFRDERRPTISFELTGGNVLGVDGAGCAVFRDTWCGHSLDFETSTAYHCSNLKLF